MGLHRTAVSDAEKAISDARRQNDSADDSLINTSVEEFYRSKAMYVWWMLRDMIGDAALKQGLSSYRADADNTSAYMQRLIESSAKRDLQWFFDDWVYHDRGLPDFNVASVYPRKMAGNNYIVTLTLQNSGTAGAEVPVVLKMVDGEINKRLEVHAKSEITVRIEARSTPLELVVNDGSVPESNTTDNVHKIEIPQKTN
jgi:aminopeptidase N